MKSGEHGFQCIDFLVGDTSNVSKKLVEATRNSFPDREIRMIHRHQECSRGDLLIALSYGHIVPRNHIEKYKLAAVIHASPVPIGRGWSPANWMLERLDREFTISLLEMGDEVDAGPVIDSKSFSLELSDLWVDFIAVAAQIQAEMLVNLISGQTSLEQAARQVGTPTYFKRRSPDDSEIDPFKPLAEQWGKIRAADPQRYPNFFVYHGRRYDVFFEPRELH